MLRLDALAWRMLIDPSSPPALHKPTSLLCAGAGLDSVHPSPEGHVLMGALAARMIFRGVTSRGLPQATIGRGTEGERIREHLLQAGADSLLRPKHTKPASHSPQLAAPWAVCYDRADRFPVLATSGWKLVDDGKAKGVLKLGLASTFIGDVLELGPLPMPSMNATRSSCCGGRHLYVELGYLVSPRAGQGAIRVSCHGSCTCISLRTKQTPFVAKLYPFPVVQTDAYYNPNEHYLAGNMSVTAVTGFVAILPPFARDATAAAYTNCSVRVKHEAADHSKIAKKRNVPPAPRATTSRVRVDTLRAWLWPINSHHP